MGLDYTGVCVNSRDVGEVLNICALLDLAAIRRNVLGTADPEDRDGT